MRLLFGGLLVGMVLLGLFPIGLADFLAADGGSFVVVRGRRSSLLFAPILLLGSIFIR